MLVGKWAVQAQFVTPAIVPLAGNNGASVVTLVCPTCLASWVYDLVPGPAGWTAQRFLTIAGGQVNQRTSFLLGADLCPAYITLWDPSTASWGAWKPLD